MGTSVAVLRDWLAWAVTWTLAVQAAVWVAVSLEAWEERTDPTLDAMPVASWVPELAYVAGVAVPLGLLLVILGLAAPTVRRAGMATAAVGLAAAAVALTGFPDGVVGAWTVGLTAAAGVGALVCAWSSDGGTRAAVGGRGSVLPGLALGAAGVLTAWSCWRGGSYWDWRGRAALTYEVGLVAAAVLVVLGATVTRWAALGSGLLRRSLIALGVLGAFWAVAGASYLYGGGVLFRWEEIESPWDFGAPFLLLGTGLVATAVASWRRRGDLAAWSLAAGTSACLVSLWQQPTWGSVMG